MTARKLSVTRVADRAQMAQQLVAIVRPGWTAEIDMMFEAQRETWVRFHGPRGLSVTVVLDGATRKGYRDAHVLSWHFDLRSSEIDLAAQLNGATFHSVNTCHYRKATDVVYSFDELLATLKNRMDAANDGSAFQ